MNLWINADNAMPDSTTCENSEVDVPELVERCISVQISADLRCLLPDLAARSSIQKWG